MSKSNILLWALVILFAGLVAWLAVTGRLQATAGLFVDGFWNFVENIVNSLRR